MAVKSLGELYDYIEMLIDDHPGIQSLPVLIVSDDESMDGFLMDIDTDGENLILTFEEGV